MKYTHGQVEVDTPGGSGHHLDKVLDPRVANEELDGETKLGSQCRTFHSALLERSRLQPKSAWFFSNGAP